MAAVRLQGDGKESPILLRDDELATEIVRQSADHAPVLFRGQVVLSRLSNRPSARLKGQSHPQRIAADQSGESLLAVPLGLRSIHRAKEFAIGGLQNQINSAAIPISSIHLIPIYLHETVVVQRLRPRSYVPSLIDGGGRSG